VPLLEREGVYSTDEAVRFVDRHGDVLGLRADFTGPVARVVASRLFDVKDVKLSYRGAVFRDVDAHSGHRRQIQQAGFEHFGAGSVDEDVAALRRTVRVARALGLKDLVVSVGSAGLINLLLDGMAPTGTAEARRALDRRDKSRLPENLVGLLPLVGDESVVARGMSLLGDAAGPHLDRVRDVVRGLDGEPGVRVVVDLAEVRPSTYYTGVFFSLYASSFPRSIAAGGRYDGLVGRFGKARPAVGATFDVEALAAARVRAADDAARPLRIALPKGRIQKDALATLGPRAPSAESLSSRALLHTAMDGSATYILVKDPDVPSYVERGAADVGVCGLDVLSERTSDVLEPIATSWGRCRMCIAAKGDVDVAALARKGTLRVATKYPTIARDALEARGLPAEIVALQGSVELAVVAGLADAFVDIVETGATLKANGLEEKEELFSSAARVVVNRAAWRLRHDDVQQVLDAFAAHGAPRA
jgi:ATP phosphoribosyltransferase regulatory subunit